VRLASGCSAAASRATDACAEAFLRRHADGSSQRRTPHHSDTTARSSLRRQLILLQQQRSHASIPSNSTTVSPIKVSIGSTLLGHEDSLPFSAAAEESLRTASRAYFKSNCHFLRPHFSHVLNIFVSPFSPRFFDAPYILCRISLSAVVCGDPV